MAGLPKELFPDENPFAQVNLTDRQIDASMDWAIPTKGKPPNTLCRGLVFENGRRLKQVARYEDLARTKGSYWVEPGGQRLHAAPLRPSEPGRSRFEVTVRGYVFAPEQFGLGYVRVKGLAIEHSASCFPRPQEGALSTRRGHHWIIEDNVVRQCNAIGIDVGDQFDTAGPDLAQGGQHVVRRNVVSDCGIGGIEGPRIRKTLLEDNVLARCGWQQAELIYETGGIKVHCTVDCVLRRNLVTDTIDAPGIWMDYTNVNSRCTQNVILDCRSSFGGIFMEASQAPNLVDHNFIWGTAGNGVYQHDCDELVVAHNFIGRSTGAGVRMQICQGRMVGDRLSTAKRNKIAGNVLVDNGSMLAISDPDNVSDGNLFAAGRTPFDLEAWRKAHGWDRNSAAAEVEATFDRRTMALTWRVAGQIPPVARMDPIAYDLLGQPRTGKTVLPGPLVSVPSSPARVPFGPHLPALRLVWQ
jgi:hypothetical protein